MPNCDKSSIFVSIHHWIVILSTFLEESVSPRCILQGEEFIKTYETVAPFSSLWIAVHNYAHELLKFDSKLLTDKDLKWQEIYSRNTEHFFTKVISGFLFLGNRQVFSDFQIFLINAVTCLTENRFIHSCENSPYLCS